MLETWQPKRTFDHASSGGTSLSLLLLTSLELNKLAFWGTEMEEGDCFGAPALPFFSLSLPFFFPLL